MKQVTITTGKATIVVVELPTGATNVVVRQNDAQSDVWYDLDGVSHMVSLPHGQWKHAGQPSQLTEEDWKGIIDQKIETDIDETEVSTTSKDIEIVYFYDYVNKTFFGDCDTATESGLSLLKANGVVLDYDFDDCPNDFCENGRIDMGYNESMTCFICEEAQEQVWLNPQIFVKV